MLQGQLLPTSLTLQLTSEGWQVVEIFYFLESAKQINIALYLAELHWKNWNNVSACQKQNGDLDKTLSTRNVARWVVTHNMNSVAVIEGRDVAQAVEHSSVKVSILLPGRLILHGGCICSLGYFPFQPMVHNWSIKGCGMSCPVCGKVYIKGPFLLIR